MFQAWFKEVSGCVKSISRVFQEIFNRVFQECFRRFQEYFKSVLEVFQGYSIIFPGCLNVPLVLTVYFKDVKRCS